MKKKLIWLSLALSFTVFAEQVIVSVPGMVCQMCVQGMKRVFSDAVENPDKDIVVDLNTKQVKLNLKTTLSDAEIKRRVADTTYNVKKIKRIPAPKAR